MANSNDMLESLMNMLSQDGAKEKAAEMLSGLLGNTGQEAGEKQQNAQDHTENNHQGMGGFTPENMEMLIKAKSMIDRFNDVSDDRITLLHAIKPFMAGRRASGIDTIVRLIQFMNFSADLQNQKGDKG